MKRALVVLLFLLPLTVFADDAPRIPARFGAILTLSGNFAAAGEDCRRGIEAALAESGDGESISIVYADSKNEPTAAISEFKRLVEVEKVSGILVNRAAMAMPINSLSKAAQIPLLGVVGHDGFVPGNEFAFQIWPNSQDEGKFLAREFLARGYKRVALVASQDEWTMASASGFKAAFTELGGSVVVEERVLATDTDFRSLILKIKDAKPDATYSTVVLSQIAPFFKQAYALHLTGARFTNFYAAKREVIDAAGSDVLEGVGFYDIRTDLPKLHAALGLPPNTAVPALTAASYAGTLMFINAVRSARSSKPEDLFAALSKTSSITAVDTDFEVEHRYVKFPLRLKTFASGVPK